MSQWAFERLALPDGAALRWAQWAAPADKGFVLLLPGRVEFIEKYSELADEWAARGFQALCLDWRGQGGSKTNPVSQIGHINSFDDYIADLDVFWNAVWLPLVAGKKTAVLAHSTGAHLALRFFGETGTQTDALIVTAPLVKVKTFGLPWTVSAFVTRIMAALFPCAYALGQGEFRREAQLFDGNGLTHDEARFAAWQDLLAAHPSLNTAGASWGWVNAAMHSYPKLLAALPRVNVPTLAFLTPDDPLIDGASEESLPRLMPRCTALRLPGSHHEVLMERDEVREKVWAAIAGFLAL